MQTITSQKVLSRVLVAIAVLTLLQIAAQTYDLYWIFPNLDRPMHLLGGIWLGFLGTWVAIRLRLITRFASFRYVFIVLLTAFLVGFGWEVFEYGISRLIDSGIALQPSTIDTALDLVLDLLGAMGVAFYYMIRKYDITFS